MRDLQRLVGIVRGLGRGRIGGLRKECVGRKACVMDGK